jgi:hypothetical protein
MTAMNKHSSSTMGKTERDNWIGMKGVERIMLSARTLEFKIHGSDSRAPRSWQNNQWLLIVSPNDTVAHKPPASSSPTPVIPSLCRQEK